jgi:type I restriction enzyme S subunit
MSNNWPKVRLGELLTRIKDEIDVQDEQTYSRLTIRMNGNGIVLRDSVPGHDIGTKKQFFARVGQLVLSKIDARNGAFGILPSECDNAIITGNFWAFDADKKRLLPTYFDYLTKTPLFVEFCVRASEGTTNRLYLQEDQFLAQEIMLPPLEDQRRIVARIEELFAQIQEARTLRMQAAEEASSILAAAHRHIFRVLAQRHKEYRIDSFAAVKGGKRLPRGEQLVNFDTGLPYIRAGNLKKGTVTGEILYLPPELQKTISSYIVASGDVYITIVGACIGDVGIIPDEFHHANLTENAAKITIRNERSYNGFLVHALRSPQVQEQLANKRTIAAQPKLALHRIRSTNIPLPSLQEQQSIVAFLDDLQEKTDGLRAVQAQSSAELDALMPSILDKAFRGEL